MKLSFLLRALLQRCRLRLIVVMAASLLAGWFTMQGVNSLRQISAAQRLWGGPALEDTVWLQYRAKPASAFGSYNSQWPENLNSLKTIPGVNALGLMVGPLSLDDVEKDLFVRGMAISSSLLRDMEISLFQGAWEPYEKGDGVIPLVMSYNQRAHYALHQEITLVLMSGTGFAGVYAAPFTFQVAGFLPPEGGYPNDGYGSAVSTPISENLVAWYPGEDVAIFPLEALPNELPLIYSVGSMIALRLDADYREDAGRVDALILDLAHRGYGTAITAAALGEQLTRINIGARNWGAGGMTVVVYLVLLLISMAGFQASFVFEKTGELATLHLLGATWRQLAGAWLLALNAFCVLPLLAGVVLSFRAITEGMLMFPLYLTPYLPPLAAAVLLCVTVCLSIRRMRQTDLILLLHSA